MSNEPEHPEHDDRRFAYSPTEVGEMLGLGRSSIYEAIAEGRIPSIKIGKKILIPKAALLKMLLDTRFPKDAGRKN